MFPTAEAGTFPATSTLFLEPRSDQGPALQGPQVPPGTTCYALTAGLGFPRRLLFLSYTDLLHQYITSAALGCLSVLRLFILPSPVQTLPPSVICRASVPRHTYALIVTHRPTHTHLCVHTYTHAHAYMHRVKPSFSAVTQCTVCDFTIFLCLRLPS